MTDLSIHECTRVLIHNYTGHLGFLSQGHPFVIPITYYYNRADHAIISYSAEGHKIDAMRINSSVSMQTEEIVSVNNWQSVLVHGTFEELHGIDAKNQLHEFTQGVKGAILQKEKRKTEFISEFSSKLYSRGTPVVYRIKILEMTGKRKET